MRSILLSSLVVLSAACDHARSGPPEGVALHSLARPAFTLNDSADAPADHMSDEIVVDFRDGITQSEIDVLEQKWGIDLEFESAEEGPRSGIAVAHVDAADEEDLLERIRQDPNVEVAEPEMRVRVPLDEEGTIDHSGYVAPSPLKGGFEPNDPDYPKQWNMKLINMPAAWEVSKGKGVIVAVLDTGIAYEDYQDFRQVPDLKGVSFVKGYNFVSNNSHANDDHGHGTHVAGTIAQATNNKEGVAGIAYEATLMPIKVLDHFGSGNTAAISDAIRWAADHDAKVINMSLGGGGRSAVMGKAVEYARKKGVVVVCAAGNGGRGIVEYPAAYEGSVAVSAVGPTGAKSPYSSWGKELDIAAPGGDKSRGDTFGILQNTLDPKDITKSVYAWYQGTSMATPHVAGIAALLYAAGAKNPDEVEKAMYASAKPPQGASGWTEQYGHGVIDASAALTALKKIQSMDKAATVAEVHTAVANDDTVSEAPMPMGTMATGFFDIEWKPMLWSFGLLAFVLLTLGRKERPGFINIIATPGFAIPLVLATVGVFFARWIGDYGHSSTLQAITLPIPDWLQKIIFGRGSLANPIVYSAALPLVASLFAIKWKGLRPIMGGLSIGFAGILAYSAWAHAPALAWLPFTFLAIPWLALNAIICLFIARAMLRREKA